MSSAWPIDEEPQGRGGEEGTLRERCAPLRMARKHSRSTSQKIFGPPKLPDGVFTKGDAFTNSLTTKVSRSIGHLDKLQTRPEDSDTGCMAFTSPGQRLMRSQSQSCTSARRNRDFRIEETGEPDDNTVLPDRSLCQQQRLSCSNGAFDSRLRTTGPVRNRSSFPGARRIACEGSSQDGSAVVLCSPRGHVTAMARGVAASPLDYPVRVVSEPAPFSRSSGQRGFGLGHTLCIGSCSCSTSDDESPSVGAGGGQPAPRSQLVMTPRGGHRNLAVSAAVSIRPPQNTSTGTTAAAGGGGGGSGGGACKPAVTKVGATVTAGRTSLSRRCSEHGNTHKGRRQSERRRAACWAADDEDGSCDDSPRSDSDTDCECDNARGSNGADEGGDGPLPLLADKSKRLLRPPTRGSNATAGAYVTPPRSSRGASMASLHAAGLPCTPIMAAPVVMAAVSDQSTAKSPPPPTSLSTSAQDLLWPQALPPLDETSSGRPPVSRVSSLHRAAVAPTADEELPGSSGALPVNGSTGSSSWEVDFESPRTSCGDTPRTSFDMFAEAAMVARRAALKGSGSKGLLLRGDSDLRRSVTWQDSGDVVEPAQLLQQQQVVVASSPRSLKAVEKMPIAGGGGGGAASMDSSRCRTLYDSKFESDNSAAMRGGGDLESPGFAARHCSGGGACTEPRSTIRLPPLQLQPTSRSCQQSFAGVPWLLRAKSSSGLRGL